jgi:hypothetical protein
VPVTACAALEIQLLEDRVRPGSDVGTSVQLARGDGRVEVGSSRHRLPELHLGPFVLRVIDGLLGRRTNLV